MGLGNRRYDVEWCFTYGIVGIGTAGEMDLLSIMDTMKRHNFLHTTDCSHFTFNSTNADVSVSVQNLLSLAKSSQIEQAANYTYT